MLHSHFIWQWFRARRCPLRAPPGQLEAPGPGSAWAGRLASLLVCAGVSCLFHAIYAIKIELDLPWWQRAAMALLAAVGLAVPLLGHGGGAGSPWQRWTTSCIGGWPSFLSLLLLATPLPKAIPLGAAWLAAVWRRRRGTRGVSHRWLQVSGLALVLAICLLYLRIGYKAQGHADNDAYYYFGVARHIARTGRLEEPIVWQFLRPTETLVHRPFDYWQGLTSLLLVPSLALLGNSHHTALTTMAVVSCVGLVGFWFLLERALPASPMQVRWLAFLGFAFAPGAAIYRFDTESVPVFQSLLTLALLALASRAHSLAVVLGGLLMLVRGEGVWACLMIGVVSLWRSLASSPAIPLRRRLGPLWSGLAFVALYVAYHRWMFQSLGPPAARLAPFAAGGSLIAFGKGVVVPPLGAWLKTRLAEDFVLGRSREAIDALLSSGFARRPEFWFFLLGLKGAGSRSPVVTVAWWVAVLGTLLSSWSNPAYFAPWRAPHVMLPALWLLNAEVLTNMLAWLSSQRRHGLVRWGLGGLVVFGLVAGALETTKVYGGREVLPFFFEREAQLRALSPRLAGQPVAAVRSWRVMADVKSPVLQIPHNGEAAVVEALKKYKIAWLVVDAPTSDVGGSKKLLDELLEGKRKTLGDLRLERVTDSTDIPLFRVHQRSR